MKILLLLVLFFQITAISFSQKKQWSITSYGAKPDGLTINTIAIQLAIDKATAAGGGKVIVPAGKFVTGVLYLKTGVELHLEKNAVLLGSTNRLDYGNGSAAALINSKGAANISITGKGIIDGRGKEVVKSLLLKLADGILQDKQWTIKAPEERNRPKLITFIECKNVSIKGITLKNAAAWVQEYLRCNKVNIDRITVLSNEYWNNDGIDIVNSKNVSITNSYFNVSDDAICLKSEGDKIDSCENIYVANCKLRSSANAFKMGTGSKGGFRNITVRNLQVFDTYRSAIAIETVDGGFLENVDIRGIHAINTGSAVFIRLGHRNKDSIHSKAKNIHIANVAVHIPAGKPDKGYPMEGPSLKYPAGSKPSSGNNIQSFSPWNNSGRDSTAIPYLHNVFPSSITGLPGHAIENVTIENIEIVYETIADKTVNYFPLALFNTITEAEKDYPEFSMFGEVPVWGFYVRHVDGLQMKNITVKMKGKDFRTAFLFNDVKNLYTEKLKSEGHTATPDIFLNNVTKAENKVANK